MKNLLIIGASGFGRGVYELALNAVGYGSEFQIKGFLDYNTHALDNYPMYPKVISSEDDYKIEENDVFICAIGDVNIKRRVLEKMEKRGAELFTLISNKANVSTSATIGKGCIIQGGVGIDAGVKIGKGCLLQSYAILGHDAVIGDYCRMDCFSMLVGGVKLGNNVIIHTSSVINHNVVIEDNATVGACSFVIRKVKEGDTVQGNPAKILRY